jgi:hypothetical protein
VKGGVVGAGENCGTIWNRPDTHPVAPKRDGGYVRANALRMFAAAVHALRLARETRGQGFECALRSGARPNCRIRRCHMEIMSTSVRVPDNAHMFVTGGKIFCDR